MKPTKDELRAVAERLRRHNRWRRGVGEFAWTGKPPKAEMPESGKSLGELIDKAVELLERMAEDGR